MTTANSQGYGTETGSLLKKRQATRSRVFKYLALFGSFRVYGLQPNSDISSRGIETCQNNRPRGITH